MSRNSTIAIVLIIVIVAVAGLAVYSPGMFGLGPAQTTQTMAPTEDPRFEAALAEGGTIVVTGSIDQPEIQPWIDVFLEKYPGLKLEYLRASPSQAYTKITGELGAGKDTADAILVSLPTVLQLKKEGLLETYRSKEAAALPKEYVDPDGQFAAVVVLTQGYCYNTELVKPEEVPKTIDDLIDPKWAGKMMMHDLRQGTSSTQYFASMKSYMPESDWNKLIDGLAALKPQLVPSTGTTVESVSTGEMYIGVFCQFHDVLGLKLKGAPIDFFRLEDAPLMVTTSPIAMITKTKHPSGTQLFIDFMLSEEGQTLIGNGESIRFPAREVDAKWSLSNLLPGQKLIFYPTEDASDNAQQYAGEFKAKFNY